MPYIPKPRRPSIQAVATHLGHILADDGDLNYAIQELYMAYIKNKTGGVSSKIGYKLLKDTWCTGVDASLEFRDRVQRVYENRKIDENGDIFELLLESISRRQENSDT